MSFNCFDMKFNRKRLISFEVANSFNLSWQFTKCSWRDLLGFVVDSFLNWINSLTISWTSAISITHLNKVRQMIIMEVRFWVIFPLHHSEFIGTLVRIILEWDFLIVRLFFKSHCKKNINEIYFFQKLTINEYRFTSVLTSADHCGTTNTNIFPFSDTNFSVC